MAGFSLMDDQSYAEEFFEFDDLLDGDWSSIEYHFSDSSQWFLCTYGVLHSLRSAIFRLIAFAFIKKILVFFLIKSLFPLLLDS